MGDNAQMFIIAEAGVNHNSDPAIARELVHVAAEAGADAVKFQSFSADRLVRRDAEMASYQVANTGRSDTQHNMLKALEMSAELHADLNSLCGSLGIEFMSTPFDTGSLRFLVDEIGVKRLKIPSGEAVNGLLLLEAARAGLPIILSTGMCTLEEVIESLSIILWGTQNPTGTPPSRASVAALRETPNWTAPLQDIVWVLQCVTQYPAPPDATNLRAMETLARETGLKTGLSDHSIGRHIAIASAARGACALEKHFTMSRDMPGPDHKASLEPDELKAMVREIRDVEAALGNGEKSPSTAERANMKAARGSIVAARNLTAGERISPSDLTVKRPGDGLSPLHLWDLAGRVLQNSYMADEPIKSDELAEEKGPLKADV